MSICQQLRLRFGKIGQHFIIGIHEQESPLPCSILSPRQFWFRTNLEFSISVYILRIMGRKKAHQIKHSVQAFPAKQTTLQQTTHTAKTCSFLSLGYRIAIFEILYIVSPHGYNATTSTFYSLKMYFLIIFINATLSFYHSPAYAIGTEV